MQLYVNARICITCENISERQSMKKFGQLFKASVIYIFPVFALILSLYARETSMAAKNALYLCLDVVIPSLFPFFVLSRLTIPYLSGFNCPKFLKRLIERFFGLPYYTFVPIILGYMSGYPTGAKLARDMFDEGLLDSRQAGRIISVTNNCSPLFMIGTIGAGFFKSVRTGFLLLLIHWVSGLTAAFFMGRIFAPYPRDASGAAAKSADARGTGLDAPDMRRTSPMFDSGRSVTRKAAGSSQSLPSLIPSAVEEAALLSIRVTGYIVFFSVLSELLARLGLFSLISSIAGGICRGGSSEKLQKIISSVSKGLIEITSGSQAISGIKDAAINVKLSAISFICGFAGFSVHTQVMGIMKGTNANYRIFLAGKLLHGLIAGLLTMTVTVFTPITVLTSNILTEPVRNFSGIRIITIGVILLSLIASPYQANPDPRRIYPVSPKNRPCRKKP